MASRDVWNDEGWVFCREDGNRLHPAYDLYRRLVKHAEAAGLPRRRFHDLRHLTATLALEAGVHPRVVADRLGHANPDVTLKTYSHVRPVLGEEAAELLAAVCAGAGVGNPFAEGPFPGPLVG